MEQTRNEYIPGTCNIGPAEIRKRRQAGWLGFAATVVLWAVFIYFNVHKGWRLFLFFPAIMSSTGFLQAYMHFCAYFGFASLFNFGDIGKTDTVQQAEFRAQDRRKAWQIVIYSVIISIIVSVLAYMI